MTADFTRGLRRYWREEQLEKLRGVTVGVAGAGGLGSNCAMLLARSGVVKLKIVDFDTVDESNLNRQFYFLSQVGRLKVEALRENLLRINPAVRVDAVAARIDRTNVRALFDACDVVVEALDQAAEKKMVAAAYMNSGKFLVAASGLAGWGDSDRIRTRRLKEKFILVGDLETEAGPDCPPLAPRVAVAAAKEADAVLQYVLGERK